MQESPLRSWSSSRAGTYNVAAYRPAIRRSDSLGVGCEH
jgi:hypothetical protein